MGAGGETATGRVPIPVIIPMASSEWGDTEHAATDQRDHTGFYDDQELIKMKKMTKVLLTLGVLMLPAGLWAAHQTVACTLVIQTPKGAVVIDRRVPVEAVDALEAHGWFCDPGCPPGEVPPC